MATGQKISAQASVTRLNDGDLGTCVQSGVNKNFNVGAVTAKAWVNFNGTGPVAIRDSFNVSSITDNGTGDYTVNLTNSMADTNYATLVTGRDQVAGGVQGAVIKASGYTASAVSIQSYAIATGTLLDIDMINVAIFGA